MTKKIDTSGLLPIVLTKMPDGSVIGVTPDGKQSSWPADYSNKPTRRLKRVMLNCFYWLPVWVDLPLSDADRQKLREDKLAAAQDAWESYDFGDEITESSGWETSEDNDYTRIAYSDSGRYNLHVSFVPNTAIVACTEAFCMESGNLVGFMPVSLKGAN